MKVTWNKNPLRTTIELDENEKKIFWYQIKVKELEQDMFSAYFALSEDNRAFHEKLGRTMEDNIKEALSELDPAYIYNEDPGKGIDARVTELHDYLLNALMAPHCGDCTCVPCSCDKCAAEGILGIDTIKGVGKHSLYKIDSAFGKLSERTIDEAIAELANYNPVMSGNWTDQTEFNKHLPRWKEEAKSSHDWLVNYRNEHFKD